VGFIFDIYPCMDSSAMSQKLGFGLMHICAATNPQDDAAMQQENARRAAGKPGTAAEDASASLFAAARFFGHAPALVPFLDFVAIGLREARRTLALEARVELYSRGVARFGL